MNLTPQRPILNEWPFGEWLSILPCSIEKQNPSLLHTVCFFRNDIFCIIIFFVPIKSGGKLGKTREKNEKKVTLEFSLLFLRKKPLSPIFFRPIDIIRRISIHSLTKKRHKQTSFLVGRLMRSGGGAGVVVLVVVRLALPPGSCVVPRLGAAEDLLLLHGVGQLVHGVLHRAGQEL